MKLVLTFAMSCFATFLVQAQLNPVNWSYEAIPVSEGVYDLVFTAHIQTGWYVYSQHLSSDDGPIPTSFHFDENAAVERIGGVSEEGTRHEGYDELFMMDIVKFSGSPRFIQRVKLKNPTIVTGYLEFMTCDNERCLPPREVPFQFTLQ